MTRFKRFKPGKLAQPGFSITMETKQFNKVVSNMISGVSSTKGASALVKLGLGLLGGIMQKSAVDTGRSRAAWYVSFNALIGKTGGRTRSPKDDAEREGMKAGSVLMKLSGFKKRIEMTNAVEYIMMLEYGWSKQAPYGMLRISMQLLRRAVPRVVLRDLERMWKRDGKPKWTPFRATKAGPGV